MTQGYQLVKHLFYKPVGGETETRRIINMPKPQAVTESDESDQGVSMWSVSWPLLNRNY
jgi:hypothetical protein